MLELRLETFDGMSVKRAGEVGQALRGVNALDRLADHVAARGFPSQRKAFGETSADARAEGEELRRRAIRLRGDNKHYHPLAFLSPRDSVVGFGQVHDTVKLQRGPNVLPIFTYHDVARQPGGSYVEGYTGAGLRNGEVTDHRDATRDVYQLLAEHVGSGAWTIEPLDDGSAIEQIMQAGFEPVGEPARYEVPGFRPIPNFVVPVRQLLVLG